jgi:tubulin--tyrosine ligase-like protein 12
LFKIAGCYRLASTEQLDETSIWYVCDELGSAIQHSDSANVKMMPFLYSEDNKVGENMWAYSIFWPLKSIASGEYIYRDYLHGLSEEKQRSSRLAIWY